MSDKQEKKGIHFNLADRMFIENALFEHMPLTEIARRLGKDPTTVSKEIKRNRIENRSRVGKDYVLCQHYKGCRKMHLCKDACSHLCYRCKITNCYRICTDYKPRECTITNRFPHVCNGCGNVSSCYRGRFFYKAKVADANYRDTLSKSRSGIDTTPDEFEHLDQLISPLILKGQSIAHIYQHHRDEISCSERTIYNYFERQVFSAKNIDLPRKVRYKKRKRKAALSLKPQRCREGRTYQDFLAYMQDYPDSSVVEMDTVHGERGGKVLLTLFFRRCSLMMAFLLEECTKACVSNSFASLHEALSTQVFQEMFSVVLTDNGSEFKAPEEIEFDKSGNRRSRVFFCDPLASNQKARIEKNHEYIRYILPKGKSFNHLTQEDVTMMMNHINSTARASLNGHTPYQLAQLLLGPFLLDAFSLKPIPPDEVLLKPTLLKR
ncbi:IS30 family transposase [Sinanaerobacter chloroacetimidivorans]|uniref:IS30 family transposase n=1 Tax=Sinanaerobacter chloroacetimidivorans TaxID=2818044 RepID=A0A8J8B4E4_9FIRM|nr:IS30 family transposase [Sinanaerobacter chloroacetimidivorans]MBR0600652.1 IS30 family transposase [Sinanaerobacter chloroacetimidivorans]